MAQKGYKLQPSASSVRSLISTMTACVTCLVSVFLLVGPSTVSARDVFVQDSTLQERFLPSLDMSSGEPKQNKLMVLLNMHDSVDRLLHGSKLNDPDIIDKSVDEAHPMSPVHKRIFCNGFTGCGGKFREQRRREMDKISNSKRISCNSHGCSNHGRKRGTSDKSQKDDERSDSGVYSSGLDLGLWLEAMRRIREYQRLHSALSSRCTGSECPQTPEDKTVGETNTAELGGIMSDLLVSSGKRFFAGQVDSQWDSFNDNLS